MGMALWSVIASMALVVAFCMDGTYEIYNKLISELVDAVLCYGSYCDWHIKSKIMMPQYLYRYF